MSDQQRMIYVVTDGDYSAYSIIGVFDDPDLAEAYRSKIGADDVEVWPLNPHADDLRHGDRLPFVVEIQRDGEARVVEPLEMVYGTALYWRHKDPVMFYRDTMTVHCFARDEQHAIKIANEKRIQVLAEGRWPGSDE